MNGAHDLGGQMGFGPVMTEADEPIFHADWEKRVLAMSVLMGIGSGRWTIDGSRHARESLPPVEYLTASYYEIWIKGLEKLLVGHGLVSSDELATGRVLHDPAPVRRVVAATDVVPLLSRGFPYERPAPAPARFAVGHRVRTRNDHPPGHTRLPRYIRGRDGVVEVVHGVHVLPDASDANTEVPDWLYGIRFDATTLWGRNADPNSEIVVDCWESYLE